MSFRSKLAQERPPGDAQSEHVATIQPIPPVAIRPPISEEEARRIDCKATICKGDYPPPTYQHKELRSAKTGFRIFRLAKGSGEEALYGELLERGLNDRVPYECLSYRWQDVYPHYKRDIRQAMHIHIGESIYLISYSLQRALRVFRLKQESRDLWIDQLCINQVNSEDNLEKAHQVANMGTIYSNAKKTLIWLDGGTQKEISGLELIRSFQPFHKQIEELAEMQFLSRQQRTDALESRSSSAVNAAKDVEVRLGLTYLSNVKSVKELKELGVSTAATLPELEYNQYHDILDFYNNSWFLRMWPVQEVVLSTEKLLHCGDQWLEWDLVGWFATFFLHRYQHLEIAVEKLKGIEAASYVYHYARAYSMNKIGFPLSTMLRMTRRFEAGRPEDKVFGLLGMINFNADSSTKPYDHEGLPNRDIPTELDPVRLKGQPPKTVFYETARYLLRKDRSLEVLTFQNYRVINDGDPLPNPSWVPFWSEREISQHVWLPHSTDNFNACAAPDHQIQCADTRVNGHEFYTCTVRGVKVGEISDTYSHRCGQEAFGADSVWTVLLVTVLSMMESISKFQFALHKRQIITELAMVLTEGRAGLGSIVITSESSGSSDKIISDHVRDFTALMLDIEADFGARLKGSRRDAFDRLINYLREQTPQQASQNTQPRESAYARRCYESSRGGKKLFRTSNGMLGIGSFACNKGDTVYVLRGGRVPFVLRSHKRETDERSLAKKCGVGTHQLVGECYVYGAMDLEFDSQVEKSAENIVLV